MSQWANSTRRDRLPADWGKIRARIMRRDKGLCQVVMEDDRLCHDLADEVDHIKAGDDHDDLNLQAICTWHHERKSSSEGGIAQARKRGEINRRFRRTEGHPGLL